MMSCVLCFGCACFALLEYYVVVVGVELFNSIVTEM
jgi:hypothetical protein